MKFIIYTFAYKYLVEDIYRGRDSLWYGFSLGFFQDLLVFILICGIGFGMQELQLVGDDLNVWMIYGVFYLMKFIFNLLVMFKVIRFSDKDIEDTYSI